MCGCAYVAPVRFRAQAAAKGPSARELKAEAAAKEKAAKEAAAKEAATKAAKEKKEKEAAEAKRKLEQAKVGGLPLLLTVAAPTASVALQAIGVRCAAPCP